MMPDVVAGPERDVGADPREGLDRVVLQDETIFAVTKPGMVLARLLT